MHFKSPVLVGHTEKIAFLKCFTHVKGCVDPCHSDLQWLHTFFELDRLNKVISVCYCVLGCVSSHIICQFSDSGKEYIMEMHPYSMNLNGGHLVGYVDWWGCCLLVINVKSWENVRDGLNWNQHCEVLGVTAHNHHPYSNCLKMREYNMRHLTASVFVVATQWTLKDRDSLIWDEHICFSVFFDSLKFQSST